MLEKFYQSEDSKSLADAADNLSGKIEIIGMNLIDFRKSSGLSATVLGNLAVSEVYINRGKRALARR